jgi:hypothetical protein
LRVISPLRAGFKSHPRIEYKLVYQFLFPSRKLSIPMLLDRPKIL